MRYHLLVLVLLASLAMPAAAQQPSAQTQQIGRRLDRIEQELRAVQRRVFPGGNVEPEISSAAPQITTSGLPASSPVADLNARVDALEGQLATLTGQAEANENRIRQAEEALRLLRESVVARLDLLESGAPTRQATNATTTTPTQTRAAPATTPATSGASTAATTTRNVTPSATTTTTPAARTASSTAAPADAGDAEEAYNAGYRLWDQGRHAEAQQALEAMARKYPQSRFASWARNLAGRAYLDEGKPATAARAFLSNYQDNPRGERAADSLFFLGQALVKLNKPVDACKAYDELQDVYGETMRDYLRQRLPAARSEARCR